MHLPSGPALVVIIVLVLLLFAAPKLPKIARSLGQSMRIFKSEVKQMKEESNSDSSAATTDPAKETPVEGRIIDDGPQGPRA